MRGYTGSIREPAAGQNPLQRPFGNLHSHPTWCCGVSLTLLSLPLILLVGLHPNAPCCSDSSTACAPTPLLYQRLLSPAPTPATAPSPAEGAAHAAAACSSIGQPRHTQLQSAGRVRATRSRTAANPSPAGAAAEDQHQGGVYAWQASQECSCCWCCCACCCGSSAFPMRITHCKLKLVRERLALRRVPGCVWIDTP